MLSNEYIAAIEKHNEAIQIFKSAQFAYRNRLIGDDEFLAAKAEYNTASNVFDLAYAQEAK